jgi:hypothetical protein
MNDTLDLDDRTTQRVIGWLVVSTIVIGLLWGIWWGRRHDLPARAVLTGAAVTTGADGTTTLRFVVEHDRVERRAPTASDREDPRLRIELARAYGPLRNAVALDAFGDERFETEARGGSLHQRVGTLNWIEIALGPVVREDETRTVELGFTAGSGSGTTRAAVGARFDVPAGVDPVAAFVPSEGVEVDLLGLEPFESVELARFFDEPIVLEIEEVSR